MNVHKHSEKATYWTVDGFIDLKPIPYNLLTSQPHRVHHHSGANYSTYTSPPVIHPLLGVVHSPLFVKFIEQYIDIPNLTPVERRHTNLRCYHPTNFHKPYLHPNLHSDIRFGIAVEVIVFLPVEGFTGGSLYFVDPLSRRKQIVENVPNRLVIIVNNDYNYKGVAKVMKSHLTALYTLDYLTFAQSHHSRPAPLYLERQDHAIREQPVPQAASSFYQQDAGYDVDSQP